MNIVIRSEPKRPNHHLIHVKNECGSTKLATLDREIEFGKFKILSSQFRKYYAEFVTLEISRLQELFYGPPS